MKQIILIVAFGLLAVIVNSQTTCPSTSTWAEWDAWTACDKDCGYCGTQTRSRICTAIAGCPDATCIGDANQNQSCSTTDNVCIVPLPSCCDPAYKKKADIVNKRFYCG